MERQIADEIVDIMTPQKAPNKVVSLILDNPSDLRFTPNSAIKKCQLNEQSWAKQKQIALWRAETDYPVFKIYGIIIQNNLSSRTVLKIKHQIPVKFLGEIKNLSIQNALYMMKSIVFTMEKLVKIVGYFKLTQNMIGLNCKNVCKIWVNQSLEENHIMEESNNQQQMIRFMLDLILNRVQQSTAKCNLISNMHTYCHNFAKFCDFLWKFSFQNNIIIPPFFIQKQKRIQRKKHIRIYSQAVTPTKRYQEPQIRMNASQIPLKICPKKQKDINKDNKVDHNPLSTRRHKKSQSSGVSTYKTNKNSNFNRQLFQKYPTQFTKITPKKEKNVRINCPFQGFKQNKSMRNTRKSAARKQPKFQSLENQNVNKNQSQIPVFSNSSFFKQQKTNNLAVMKKMIKQKVNRKKNTVKKLETCGTVRSIGDFQKSQVDLSQYELAVLGDMGRNVDKSIQN